MTRTRLFRILLATALAASLTACVADDDLGTAQGASAASGDRYIVAFKNAGAGEAALAAAGGQVKLRLDAHGAVAAEIPAAALNGLRNNPNVEYVEADHTRVPLGLSSEEVVPYGISMVQADQVSDASAGNRTVCIIDSGYDLGHPDLSTANVEGTNDSGTGDWFVDTNGHGTHVAGTIAAVAGNGQGVVGVNPNGNLNLHIIKVFDENGWAYSSSLVAALDACRAAGANVVSMSLGGSFKSRTEDRAFAKAYSAGVLSIAAAGNDGSTRKSYPASYDSVVSVAAVDDSESHASFSQQNDQVEVAAAGVGVLSTVPRGTGQETTLTVGTADYEANAMDGSPVGTGSGALVDCGTGESVCPGATGKTCLIARGTISFADKVLSCENGGGVAAVIYNNEPGALYGTLGDVTTTIPSAGVSDSDGAALLNQLGATANLALTASHWAAWDGTSMATPHVAGVAALIWSHDPSWTNAEIRDALRATASNLGSYNTATGYGVVRAQTALDYLGGASSCTPTTLSCDGIDNDCDGLVDEADECPATCEPTALSCTDGVDNDCDGLTDADDVDECPDAGTCTLAPIGASCDVDADCCSSKCRGKPGAMSCK